MFSTEINRKKVIRKPCKSNGGLIKCSWLKGGSSSLGQISLRLKITAELVFDKGNQLHKRPRMKFQQNQIQLLLPKNTAHLHIYVLCSKEKNNQLSICILKLKSRDCPKWSMIIDRCIYVQKIMHIHRYVPLMWNRMEKLQLTPDNSNLQEKSKT